MILENNIPLVECNIKEQLIFAEKQISFNGLTQYKKSLDELIELIAITKPHIGSILIVEKFSLLSDCVDNEILLFEYVKNFGWDMLWWGKVTEDLIQYCVDKNNV